MLEFECSIHKLDFDFQMEINSGYGNACRDCGQTFASSHLCGLDG